MRVTPPLPFLQGFRQYAKGRYAARENPIISYADINLYFRKGPIFIKKHNKREYFARSLSSRFLAVISVFTNFNIDYGRSNTRESNKQTHQS